MFRLYGAYNCFHKSSDSMEELKELVFNERGIWTIRNENNDIVARRDSFGFWDNTVVSQHSEDCLCDTCFGWRG